ncbi:hypothetical protein IAD21_03535 [Abditibacteriota bacterium]|nr:hypothetical protein IAD21_03535 [Abditibacteriota bacterium]
MATKKKFDIENPTDEMIENLEASKPEEDGFHITKLSERDSKALLDLLQNPPAPGEELKKAREASKRMLIIR